MKTMRKCPNCQMKTSKQIAEGITHRKWYRYFECEQCKKIQSYRINKPATVETEYSVSSMETTPIGINAKNWPTHEN